MGIITRVFFRGNGLSEPPNNQLWLDIEENIHIHFRDLRIELGRQEFEEFVAAFSSQAEELLQIITDTSYQDGVFSNMGKNRTVVNTGCHLQKPIKYHGNELSIEDCTDGIHLHYRNYKLLLTRDDFRLFLRTLNGIDLDSFPAICEKSFLDLLRYNDIDYAIENENANGPKTIFISYPRVPLLKAVLKAIQLPIKGDSTKWSISTDSLSIFIKFASEEQIRCKNNPIHSILNFKDSFVRHIPLTTYLVCRQSSIDRNHINLLKCQALEIFEGARKQQEKYPINLDYREWVYDLEARRIVFPFLPSGPLSDPWEAYLKWEQFLIDNKLFFIKPTKSILPDRRQLEIVSILEAQLIDTAINNPGIEELYTCGSTATLSMGIYTVPFVHFNWCKLASDLDVYVEIDEAHADEVPSEWIPMRDLKKASADYYHLGDIPMERRSEYFDSFPHINFYEHLIEALLFYPSRSEHSAKDAFLNSRPHKLVYSKSIWEFLRTNYELECSQIDRMNDIVVRNELYKVSTNRGKFVLKIFNCEGGPNYLPADTLEHCIYEQRLVAELLNRGFFSPKVVSPVTGDEIASKGKYPVILYEYIDGRTGRERSELIRRAAAALAKMHNLQRDPLGLTQQFDLFFGLDIWIDIYSKSSRVRNMADPEVLAYYPLYDSIISHRQEVEKWLKTSGIMWVHNHGDITPTNFIIQDDDVCVVDFQGAYYGPRISDLAEGALEFSLDQDESSKRYLINRDHVKKFVTTYCKTIHLTSQERRMLPVAFAIAGFLRFIREVIAMSGPSNAGNHRRNRALGFSDFVSEAIEHLGWNYSK